MTEFPAMNFADTAVARAYDTGLVPLIFGPWARKLVNNNGPWDGFRVLDLACGTGIVAHTLAEAVGESGKVFAADFSAEMLHVAQERCSDHRSRVQFVESPASPLALSNRSIDRVVCQQGFQFFDDRTAAAKEIYRVLRPGGDIIISTWCSVQQCHYFGMICKALAFIGAEESVQTLRIPFDFMPLQELSDAFELAGFTNVNVSIEQDELNFPDGLEQAIETSYSTPIGATLASLSDASQAEYRKALRSYLVELIRDDDNIGHMTSLILTAHKPSAVTT
jgi:ubiquinone/menaquinone biosynthesis C-methylase UbiE